MLTRTLGSFFRGKATAPQVILASVLGGMLGFVPASSSTASFAQAPGLVLALLCAVMVLDASLALFAGVAALAKVVSGVLLPVSVGIGRVLLDGPLAPLFAALSNAPVTAWFGFEYYATSGALFLGFVFGTSSGLLVWKSVSSFRSKMAGLEAGSERYQRLMSKRWCRFLLWLLFGSGHGKKSYQELASGGKRRLPIRWSGAVLVGVFVVSLTILHAMLGSTMLRGATQSGLEKWNTATVDLAGASLHFGAGSATLEGLALADPKQLDHDLFRARKLELAIDTGALLSRRLVISQLTSADAQVGAKRNKAGRVLPQYARTAPAPKPEKKPAKKPEAEKPVEAKIEDYIKAAEKWKARLAQASGWLAKLSGPSEAEKKTEKKSAPKPSKTEGVPLELAFADHLRTKAPAVLIRDLKLEGVASSHLPGDLLDIHAKNLSSHPSLVKEPFELTIRARSGKFELRLSHAAGRVETKLSYRGVPVDEAMAAVTWPGKQPMSGGTLDFQIAGSLEARREGAYIDLPLELVFHDTTVSVPQVPETRVKTLKFPLGVHGPLASPSIKFRPDEFTKSLLEAGKAQLTKQLEDKGKKLLEEHAPEVDKLKKAVENKSVTELEAAKKDAEKKAAETGTKLEDEAKKSLEKIVPKSIVPKGIIPKGIIPAKPK